MGFILKTNGRKLRSGAKIQAKIVTEDKKSFLKTNYDFLIQVKELTNQEKVLRDAQQVASLLDAANGVINNTYMPGNSIAQIASLTNTQGSYGSWIYSPQFIGNATINQQGKILTRPKYGQNNVTVIMSIEVAIGNPGDEDYAHTTIKRNIIIQAFNEIEIIQQYIRSALGDNKFWNFIKKKNFEKERVFSNLKFDTEEDTYEQFNNNFTFDIGDRTNVKLSDIMDQNEYENNFGIELTYSSISAKPNNDESASPVVIDNTSMATERKSFSVIKSLNNAVDTNDNTRICTVDYITNQSVTDFDEKLKIINNDNDTTTERALENDYNHIIACRVCEQMPNPNGLGMVHVTKAKMVCSLPDSNSDDPDAKISYTCEENIKYTSKAVDADDIISNISDSAKLSWILPHHYFNTLNDGTMNLSDNEALAGTLNSDSSRRILKWPSNKHLVLRLPCRIESLHLQDANITDDFIADTHNINYYTSADAIRGFSYNTTKGMFTFGIQIKNAANGQGIQAYISDNVVDPGDISYSPSGASNSEYINDGNGHGSKYIVIPCPSSGNFSTLYASGIRIDFSINMKENSLTTRGAGAIIPQTTFYILVSWVSPS